MSTLAPFNMFERVKAEELTESALKDCAAVLEQTVNEVLKYISKDKQDLTGIDFKTKLENVWKVVEEIHKMFKFIDKLYFDYLNARNREVEELTSRGETMRDCVDHYIELDVIRSRITFHVQTFKTRIQEAAEFDSAVMLSLMKGFKSQFKSYFKVIVDFHASKDINMVSHVAKTDRYKKQYNEMMEIFKSHVKEQKDELKLLLNDLNRKQVEVYELKRKAFLRRNEHTLSEFEGFLFAIDNLKFSDLLERNKFAMKIWSQVVDLDMMNLKRVVKSCYIHEVTMEAVGLKNKVDLKQVQVLGHSDVEYIDKKLVWVTERFACVSARCFALKKEAEQTRKRMKNLMKPERTTHTNAVESDDK